MTMSECIRVLTEEERNQQLVEFDTVTKTTVYTGSFSYLKEIELEWHKEFCEGLCMDLGFLTFNEIAEQVGKDKMITVFVQDPFVTEIYQYGNYKDTWMFLGTVGGYA